MTLMNVEQWINTNASHCWQLVILNILWIKELDSSTKHPNKMNAVFSLALIACLAATNGKLIFFLNLKPKLSTNDQFS